MASVTFCFSVLLIFAVCFPTLGSERVFAMGSKSSLDQIHREGKQEEKTGQGPEKDKRVEKGVQKGDRGGQEEKSPPKKKPRLKYRDPYECGC